MTEVGVLGDPRAAQALVDYLRSQGIEARLLAAEDGYAVMVEDAQHHRGREEFERFVADPHNKRYLAASWQSGDAKVQFQYGGGGSLWRSFLSGAGPLTLSLLVVVSAIWVFWILGFDQLIFSWTHFFPSWDAMGEGQWWRLFTPSLIHFSAMHVIFNLLWWWYLGGRIERVRGTGTLLILLLVAGTLPNLAQFAFSGPNFGGLSGVVYALVGYCWISGRLDPRSPLALPPAYVGFLLLWLVMGFAGFMNMANAAHLGGLLVGMAQAVFDRRRQ
ncbi:Rhomboid family protein [Ferrimonas balearica DSM 9799]|uniref:Rhomboid family protein n=1 Tax=Ferrimonas balearica (strain DSM 9799 / CCM 4581 / KCTC 23876 / PAT) TaxID=550540 RepID=E1SKX7_FERBD|nr:rhomboid family intramembrane serine protease GlpG [Ferrimonas balearica]ADN74371.1 Rhomboid family protein [Ferrimonas balearica DSM 9799]MBW3141206.1 rhomboid family intramembrane serine protease GlpG [Ferrimonas balearica]MBW3166065.1 rhomboid family intramembrane serine protease GlpG [Ferrimonas balearica]MBY6108239.1 rhomboid family intramembrane serine protease GlpG [Ferrimonas balearica]MBY6225625.1 rhomboid family intramembrane serine protease GlpG [Ferrimonas balearica]